MTSQSNPAAIDLTLEIPASRVADAKKRVGRFARKAAKMGMQPPTMTVVREFTRFWVVSPGGVPVGVPVDGEAPVVPDRHRLVALDLAEVQIVGERPVIGGWDFAATLEHTDAGNIIRGVPGATDLPESMRDANPDNCDHCGKRRRRNHTFVVRNADGECKQVGRSCLQDFLGDASPAAWMETFKFLRSVRELEGYGDGEGFTSASNAVALEAFLACVSMVVRTTGYNSASRASVDNPATGHVVWSALTSRHASEMTAEVTDADREQVRAALAWIASDEAGNTQYIHNLRVACKVAAATGPKQVNLIASLIPACQRAAGIRAERASKVNEHIEGAAGDRVEVDVKVSNLRAWEGYYGWTYILIMEDADGRCLVWKTSNPGDLEQGSTVRVRGTIKELGEYKGRKQTVLTRCKVVSERVAA